MARPSVTIDDENFNVNNVNNGYYHIQREKQYFFLFVLYLCLSIKFNDFTFFLNMKKQ
jgi:hypothetical protein